MPIKNPNPKKVLVNMNFHNEFTIINDSQRLKVHQAIHSNMVKISVSK